MKEVFEAHPNVDKIFLVDGMPFFKYNEALNYAGGFTDKVQTYTRLQAEQELVEPTEPVELTEPVEPTEPVVTAEEAKKGKK